MIYMPCHVQCWGMFREHTTSSKYFQDSILEASKRTLTYRALA